MSPLRPNVLPVVSQRGFSRAVAGDIRLTTSDDPVPGIRPVNDRPVNDRRDKPSVRDRHQSAPIVLPPHPTSTSQRYGAEFD